jgi:ribonuclease M5
MGNTRVGAIDKLHIQEIIVVEGIHDRQAVEAVCEAEVWVIGGDRIAQRFLQSLQRAAAVRGVIVFTDPDGAGERIRQRLAKAVPSAKHAFVSRAEAASAKGLGIEHTSGVAIRQALERAKPAAAKDTEATFTMSDLLDAGLAGTPDAARRRQQVGDALSIGSGNAKAFLRKLNALHVTRDELLKTVESAEGMDVHIERE